jgi:BASS family bile acid:Na+ symporter
MGYCCGQFGGKLLKLSPGMKRALTLEVGMQNAGLGATLASELFPANPSVAIAPAFYTFFCMFTGTILAWYWSGKKYRSQDLPTIPA